MFLNAKVTYSAIDAQVSSRPLLAPREAQELYTAVHTRVRARVCVCVCTHTYAHLPIHDCVHVPSYSRAGNHARAADAPPDQHYNIATASLITPQSLHSWIETPLALTIAGSLLHLYDVSTIPTFFGHISNIE
eukprot:scpid86498/ scgid8693/ 